MGEALGKQKRAAGIAYGVAAGAVWGLVFLAPELAREFGPLHLAAGRYVAYGLFAAVLMGRQWAKVTRQLERKDWISLAWLALLGNTLYYVLLAGAVQQGGIAMTSLVIGFLPVVVASIGSMDADAVPFRKLIPSLLIGLLATVAIGAQSWLRTPPGGGGRAIVGLVCAIGALASWSAFAVGNSRALGRLHHVTAHEWNLLTGVIAGVQGLLVAPFALFFEPVTAHAAGWMRFVGVSVAVSLLASIVGNVCWNRMSRLLPLTMVGQMILFETLFALLYGFLWERRLPTALEVIAMLLLLVSTALCFRVHRLVHDEVVIAA